MFAQFFLKYNISGQTDHLLVFSSSFSELIFRIKNVSKNTSFFFSCMSKCLPVCICCPVLLHLKIFPLSSLR